LNGAKSQSCVAHRFQKNPPAFVVIKLMELKKRWKEKLEKKKHRNGDYSQPGGTKSSSSSSTSPHLPSILRRSVIAEIDVATGTATVASRGMGGGPGGLGGLSRPASPPTSLSTLLRSLSARWGLLRRWSAGVRLRDRLRDRVRLRV